MKKALKRWTVLVWLSTSLAGCAGGGQTAQPMEARHNRLQTAEAMFQERCKKAGEKIYRTVENVEGVFLLKIRLNGINHSDQYSMNDPYGRDAEGEGYIQTFLKQSFASQGLKSHRPGWPERIGYRYVDAIDSKDGKRYRYTGGIKNAEGTSSVIGGGDGKTIYKSKAFVLDRTHSPDPPLRYGVMFNDISTREEREYWIAGSSLQIIDLQTNEVIAERIGYMMDLGQGNTANGRSPWLMAADHACPDFHRFPDSAVTVSGAVAQFRQTQDFVEKILKPIKE